MHPPPSIRHVDLHLSQLLKTIGELLISQRRRIIQSSTGDEAFDGPAATPGRLDDLDRRRMRTGSHLPGKRCDEGIEIELALGVHHPFAPQDVDATVQHSANVGQPGFLPLSLLPSTAQLLHGKTRQILHVGVIKDPVEGTLAAGLDQ